MIDGHGVRRGRGFTVIELLIGIVLMAVLLALAAPSVKQYAANQRVKASAVELVAALNYARSEAIKRNEATLLMPDGTWAEAWVMVVGGNVIRRWDLPAGLNITGGPDEVEYLVSGRTGVASEFVVCNSESDVPVVRRIVRVDASGRPNVARGERC